MAKLIDLTGQVFGKLTVISKDNNKTGHGAYWICKCECGNIKSIKGQSLREGKISHCGCSKIQQEKIDTTSLIGKKFGRLTVIARDLQAPRGHGYSSRWICMCDCGKEVSVSRTSLGKKTNSCGCLKSELVTKKNTLDLTNQKFGKLIALENTFEKNNHNSYLWLCKCECGTIKKISSEDLNSGKVKSCGCLKSKGELKIKTILEENNIFYQPQFTFYDLRGKNNGLLRFDFAILDKNNNVIKLIEFDGEQHFNSQSKFYNQDIIENDKIKNEYAIKNNIPLYRIPYTEYNFLSLETIFDNRFLVK